MVGNQRMTYVEINPHYQEAFLRQGLATPDDFGRLPSVIISGHPDRNVARIDPRLTAPHPMLIKREHMLLWKHRLVNALAGFKFVSRSQREAIILQKLAAAGVGCPEWVAHGLDSAGRAFLVVREVEDAIDLRRHLLDLRADDARRRFLQQLGRAIALLHNAGFDQPDLYSKHVLVRPSDSSVWLLDWQRSRPGRIVGWKKRWRDLAALSATVGNHLADSRDRLAFLGAYLRECRKQGLRTAPLLRCAFLVLQRETRLLARRRIREMRGLPLPTGVQSLVWRDGEALCLSSAFDQSLKDLLPDWLLLDYLPKVPRRLEMRDWVFAPGHRQCVLTRRRETRPLVLLWSWLLRRGRPVSPELRSAGLLFQLERGGVSAPRLLAFGQRTTRRAQIESFLLSEPPSSTVSLIDWLRDRDEALATHRGTSARSAVLRQFGVLVRRLHEAACVLPLAGSVRGKHKQALPDYFTVECLAGSAKVALARVEGLSTRRSSRPGQIWPGLEQALAMIEGACLSRTDRLRVILACIGTKRLPHSDKKAARKLLARSAGIHAAAASFSRLRARPLLAFRREAAG
jgi:tRNA A-37 threonylcarbamoyl transferase component Bud32